MNAPQPQQITFFAGFDWAKDHHDVVVVDDRGSLVEEFCIDHSIDGWKLWRQKIANYPGLAVAIETSSGPAVEQLLESGVTVYPVNPMNAKRYRERKCSSGNKTDRHDAWALADALRLDGQGWRALAPQDPLIAELRLLCRDEVALIEERTALINQLQQALHEYYPTALEAFDDWTSPAAWAFVETFPTAADLVKAGKRKWEKFLHTHRLGRPQTYPKRMEAFGRAGQWTAAAATVAAKSLLAVARCRQLRVLESQLDAYRKRIEALFASHPDSGMFGSLPGAGPKIAPRLLAEIGSDRGGRHRTGQLPVRANPQSQVSPVLQQASASCHASSGGPQPQPVCLGCHLLCGLAQTRQNPRPSLALLRSKMAKDHLENVADQYLLQSRTAHPEPSRSWFLGAQSAIPINLCSHANKNPENGA